MQRVAHQEQSEVRRVATHDEGLATWARLLKKDRNFNEFARIWWEPVQTNPKDAQAINELGSALACAGRFEEALQWFQRALGIQPDFSAAQINVGIALRNLGRSEGAISTTQAIASCPDDAIACFNLGLALKSVQRLDEAFTWLRRAIRMKA